MAKKRKKYYTVWRGNETGVFDNWKDCSKAVEGYKGAIYKSFPDEGLAWDAYEGNYADYVGRDKKEKPHLTAEALRAAGKPIMDSISVDAACNSKTGLMEYRGVDTKSGAEFFRMGPFEKGSNNIGEFLAIVHALSWCQKHGFDWPVYTDSNTALVWVRNKKARTKVTPSQKNQRLFELLQRAEQWLQNNTPSNKLLKWNTEAWGEIPADFGRK